MSWLDEFVQAIRVTDTRVIESLNGRGVSDEQIHLFSLGHLWKTLPNISLPSEFLKWAQGGEKLKDVYAFPLTNILNQIQGVQFRARDKSKLGYMDYIEFRGEAVHFGLGQAAPHIFKRRTITTVEGNFDLFPIQRHDPTVVSTLTARVSGALNQWMLRVCERVVLGFDNDKTGRLGVSNFRKFHSRDYKEIVDLQFPEEPFPNGKLSKDPGDYWELKGDAQILRVLKQYDVIGRQEYA